MVNSSLTNALHTKTCTNFFVLDDNTDFDSVYKLLKLKQPGKGIDYEFLMELEKRIFKTSFINTEKLN